MQTKYQDIQSFITKDGSIIRELMHPVMQGNHNQSLAQAIVSVGTKTALHKHYHTEELYHITQGEGLMTLGDQLFKVCEGDTVAILPGTPHCIECISDVDLHILCACSPAYSYEDTELLIEGDN